jgi:hypothetical protein
MGWSSANGPRERPRRRLLISIEAIARHLGTLPTTEMVAYRAGDTGTLGFIL